MQHYLMKCKIHSALGHGISLSKGSHSEGQLIPIASPVVLSQQLEIGGWDNIK